MQLTEEVRLAIQLPRPRAAKQIRLAAGLSQARMADELDVHRVTIARWEAGTHSPRGPERARYAVLLNEIQRELTLNHREAS